MQQNTGMSDYVIEDKVRQSSFADRCAESGTVKIDIYLVWLMSGVTPPHITKWRTITSVSKIHGTLAVNYGGEVSYRVGRLKRNIM